MLPLYSQVDIQHVSDDERHNFTASASARGKVSNMSHYDDKQGGSGTWYFHALEEVHATMTNVRVPIVARTVSYAPEELVDILVTLHVRRRDRLLSIGSPLRVPRNSRAGAWLHDT